MKKFFLVFMFLSATYPVNADIKTEGDNSPIVNDTKGNVIINYGDKSQKENEINLPKTKVTNLPDEILQHIQINSPSDLIEKIIGIPSTKEKDGELDVWNYEFANARLLIKIRKEIVTSISLFSYNKENSFDIYPLYDHYGGDILSTKDFQINKITLGQISKISSLDIERQLSARNIWYDIKNCYFGRPGSYLYYAFGNHVMNIDEDMYDDNVKPEDLKVTFVIISDNEEDARDYNVDP